MSDAKVAYVPHSDATCEAERAALAGVYQIVLEASRKKKAVPDSQSNDATVRNEKGVSHVNKRPD